MLFIGGNEVIALATAILVGKVGIVVGISYNEACFVNSGYGHFLGDRLHCVRLPENSHGYADGAPYDVIFVESRKWKPILRKQLGFEGIAYDLNSKFVVHPSSENRIS